MNKIIDGKIVKININSEEYISKICHKIHKKA